MGLGFGTGASAGFALGVAAGFSLSASAAGTLESDPGGLGDAGVAATGFESAVDGTGLGELLGVLLAGDAGVACAGVAPDEGGVVDAPAAGAAGLGGALAAGMFC